MPLIKDFTFELKVDLRPWQRELLRCISSRCQELCHCERYRCSMDTRPHPIHAFPEHDWCYEQSI